MVVAQLIVSLSMGLFRNIFRAAFKVTASGLYLGSFYTFVGYFYVEEIKHRLGDSQKCQAIQLEEIDRQLGLRDSLQQSSSAPTIFLVNNIFTFYSRTWNYREYESLCTHFHKNVIQSMLKNYREYGVLNNTQQMEEDIRKQDINTGLLAKIIQVKELNMQIMTLYAKQYVRIVEKQRQLRTGNLIGLTQQQADNINLIFNYIEKGERYIFKDEQKLWEYKMLQNDTKKHRYNDTIFRLLFI